MGPRSEVGPPEQHRPSAAAARIDKAVMDFASTGKGAIERIDADDPSRFRLRVEGAEARLFIDIKARTILVTGVYCRR